MSTIYSPTQPTDSREQTESIGFHKSSDHGTYAGGRQTRVSEAKWSLILLHDSYMISLGN